MAPGLRAGDDASLPLRGVIAGADRPSGLLGAGPCRFDVLDELASPGDGFFVSVLAWFLVGRAHA